MSYDFTITKEEKKVNMNNLKLNNEFFLHYKNEEYLAEYSKGSKSIFCYGYCFDVRNPKEDTYDTLKHLVVNNSFYDDLAYLNGQYIVIYKEDNDLYFTADALSLVPIYIKRDFTEISNTVNDGDEWEIFNTNLIMKLTDKSLKRIEVSIGDYNDDFSEKILELVKQQYKFFLNKNIVLSYKSNNYMKTLISIMKSSLYDNILFIPPSSNMEIDRKFGELICKDFNMRYTENMEEISTKNIFYLRNQLFDYNQFSNVNNLEKEFEHNVVVDEIFNSFEKKKQNTELSIMTRKRKNSLELSKNGLLFDPFNVHAIYQVLLKRSSQQNDITDYIVKELLPSIDFYDMSLGSTLSQVNDDLTIENKKLQKNQITAKNEQFLMDSKLSFFNVSNNLSGKVKNREIIVYPAIQEIQAGEKFAITYENPGVGFIYIKSYYKNHKNGQSITVTIEGQKYTIDELYNGLLFNVKNKLKITMQYKNKRGSLPWQKAGTLLIRQE